MFDTAATEIASGAVLGDPTVPWPKSSRSLPAATTGTTPEPMTMVMERLSGANIDLGSLAYVFDPDAYAGGKGDGLWKTVIASGSYSRLSASSGNREVFTAGPVAIGPLEVRQTPKPLASLLDDLIAANSAGGAAFDKFMDENIAALIGWFKVDALSIKDIAGFPPDGKVTLASAVIKDLSSESMKHLELDGLSVDAPEIAIKLHKLELGDVVWPTTSAIVTIAKLQDAKNRRQINADESLKPIFGGKSQVSMFEMTKLVNKHLK